MSVWSDPLPVLMFKNFGFIKNLILELWRGMMVWNKSSFILHESSNPKSSPSRSL